MSIEDVPHRDVESEARALRPLTEPEKDSLLGFLIGWWMANKAGHDGWMITREFTDDCMLQGEAKYDELSDIYLLRRK